MGKKRKSIATRLDEVDRVMYSAFCSAANSLSQLNTQAVNQQKVAFQAGERHALEKLYQWILRQHELGSWVAPADIISYVQNEIDFGDDMRTSPRIHSQNFHLQPASAHAASFAIPNILAMVGQTINGFDLRHGHIDQTKNTCFFNALSSPVRRTLQTFHFPQGDTCYPSDMLPVGNGTESSDMSLPNRCPDAHLLGSNDGLMDMH